MRQDVKYSAINDEEEGFSETSSVRATRTSSKRVSRICWSLLVLSLSLNVFQFVRPFLDSTGTQLQMLWRDDLKSLPPFERVRFDAPIMPTSKFAGYGPQADAEWDRFTKSDWVDGTTVLLTVTEEDMKNSGLRDDLVPFNTTAKLDEINGGGHIATLEIFHQMHCLNNLRKLAFKHYYEDKDTAFFNSHGFEDHISHCIDNLRTFLMCKSDTQLIPLHWVDNWPGPVPNFGVEHVCRDADKVLQWAKERAAPIVQKPLRPANAIALPKRP